MFHDDMLFGPALYEIAVDIDIDDEGPCRRPSPQPASEARLHAMARQMISALGFDREAFGEMAGAVERLTDEEYGRLRILIVGGIAS